MKIAVISDIHENFHNLLHALEIMRMRQVEQILCLGDLIHPGIAKVMVDCGIPTFSIWGNNDGDKVLIVKMSLSEGSSLEMSDKTYALLEFDGRNIFITHYPELVEPVARSGLYDAVFYGHDHLKYSGRAGECLVINPGELAAQKTKMATFVIYDTSTNQVEFVEIEKPVTLRSEYVDDYFSR